MDKEEIPQKEEEEFAAAKETYRKRLIELGLPLECKHVVSIQDDGTLFCIKCSKMIPVNWTKNSGGSGFGK